MSSEYIPLYHYMPGGVALVLWIPLCRNPCKSCPWHAVSSDRDVSLLNVGVDAIVEIADRVKADYIFMHGGDVINHIDAEILTEIKSRSGKPLGLKLHYYDKVDVISRISDVVLIEIPLSKVNGIEKSVLEIQVPHEILITGSLESEFDTEKLLKILKSLSGTEVPVHIYIDMDLGTANYISRYGDRYGIKYLYMPLLKASSFNTTYCPKCKALIVHREGGIILRHRAYSTECPICHTKVLFREAPRRIRCGVNYPVPYELIARIRK